MTLSVTITNINFANLASAVWDQLKSAHTGAGTFGQSLQANVDVNTSTLAPVATALSTAQWTNARASNLDNLDATVSSRATQTSVSAIPTNPLLTTDGRLNNLDATISSRASQTSVNAIPTNPLLTTDSRLNNLDATISSRSTQSSVSAIPTTPQLASVALTQYNSLVSAIGSIQNNSNFSGIVPQTMDEQYGAGTKAYTFYASVFSDINAPIDPDSNVLNFTVKDNTGTVLQAQAAMTRVSTGQYTGVFTVTSSMGESDVVVFFDYAISSVNYEQVRTSKITSIASDSANIAAIKAKTDNLPSDPASNTVVNTRASQTSVNAIPINPLLTTDARLNNLDATISSRATQTSVSAIPINPLLTSDTRLNHLDADISSRASQTSVSAIPTNPLLTTDSRVNNLDTTISSRASQTSLDADFGNMSTLVTNLQSTSVSISTTESALATDVTNLGTEVTALNSATSAITTAATDVEAAATKVQSAASLVVATVL